MKHPTPRRLAAAMASMGMAAGILLGGLVVEAIAAEAPAAAPDIAPLPEPKPRKAAMVEMTRCLALDLKDDGIRVNAISPGWVMTENVHNLLYTQRGWDDARIKTEVGVCSGSLNRLDQTLNQCRVAPADCGNRGHLQGENVWSDASAV